MPTVPSLIQDPTPAEAHAIRVTRVFEAMGLAAANVYDEQDREHERRFIAQADVAMAFAPFADLPLGVWRDIRHITELALLDVERETPRMALDVAQTCRRLRDTMELAAEVARVEASFPVAA